MLTRRSFGGIFFTCDRFPGQKSKLEVVADDAVTVEIDSELAQVNNVVPIITDHFKGTLYGLEPGVAFQEIQFNQAHIFGGQKRLMISSNERDMVVSLPGGYIRICSAIFPISNASN